MVHPRMRPPACSKPPPAGACGSAPPHANGSAPPAPCPRIRPLEGLPNNTPLALRSTHLLVDVPDLVPLHVVGVLAGPLAEDELAQRLHLHAAPHDALHRREPRVPPRRHAPCATAPPPQRPVSAESTPDRQRVRGAV
eukprot:927534-Prorocentrum_minimum.AAC.1